MSSKEMRRFGLALSVAIYQKCGGCVFDSDVYGACDVHFLNDNSNSEIGNQ